MNRAVESQEVPRLSLHPLLVEAETHVSDQLFFAAVAGLAFVEGGEERIRALLSQRS